MVRLKLRYLVLEVVRKDRRTDDTIGPGLLTALRSAILARHGDAGLASAVSSMQVVFYSPYSGLAIVRCSRDSHRQVLAAALALSMVSYMAVRVRLLRLTGAARVCKRVAVEQDAALLGEVRLSAHQRQLAARESERLAALEV